MKLLIIPVLLLMTACVSTWQSSAVVHSLGSAAAQKVLSEKVPEDGVHVYLYRKSGYVGSLTAWPVQLNGIKIGTLKNGAFLLIKTNAGKKILYPEMHAGILDGDGTSFQFDTKKGQTYFLKHGTSSIYSSELTFFSVHAGIAKAELGSYSLVGIHDEYKQTETTLVGAVSCKYWKPKVGITDEEKAWREIKKNIKTLRTELYKLKNTDVNLDKSVKIKGTDIPLAKLMTTVDVLKKVNEGDYKGAAQDVSSELISYLVPFAGQYKAFLDAGKTSVDAVLANWTESLYLMPAYQALDTMYAHEIARGNKLRKPYYPTAFLKGSSKLNPLYQEMKNRERAIYLRWKDSSEYAHDFDIGAAEGISFVSTASENASRLRHLIGHEPIPVEIYTHFYKKILEDRRSQIISTYENVMEELMFDEMYDMKPKVISAVCSQLHKSQNG
jgi:hypothetical protein